MELWFVSMTCDSSSNVFKYVDGQSVFCMSFLCCKSPGDVVAVDMQ